MVALARIAEHNQACAQRVLAVGALKLSKAAFKSKVPPWHAAAAVLTRSLGRHGDIVVSVFPCRYTMLRKDGHARGAFEMSNGMYMCHDS